MRASHSIDTLESDVLQRISRHRAESHDRANLTASTLAVIVALAVGVIVGCGYAQRISLQDDSGSESIVLADAAHYAPSDLLARTQ